MSELWHSPALLPVSATGVLTLVVLMVFTGQLVPKRIMDRLLKTKDERLTDAIARGDEYKKTAETYREALNTRDGQLGELLEYARTADQILRAFKEEARR